MLVSDLYCSSRWGWSDVCAWHDGMVKAGLGLVSSEQSLQTLSMLLDWGGGRNSSVGLAMFAAALTCRLSSGVDPKLRLQCPSVRLCIGYTRSQGNLHQQWRVVASWNEGLERECGEIGCQEASWALEQDWNWIRDKHTKGDACVKYMGVDHGMCLFSPQWNDQHSLRALEVQVVTIRVD